MGMVTKRTSYKTLISLPILCETEVNGKTIYDESLYDYTLRILNISLIQKCIVTMMYKYMSRWLVKLTKLIYIDG